MAKRYDAVVIGGGHNGLVNAAYLAKAGKKVARARAAARSWAAPPLTEEIVPGFRFSVFSYVVSLLRPEIIRELRAAQARPRDPAARRHDHAARRRLPLARERPRQDGPRAPPLVAERRRGLRGVRPADGRDGRGSSSRSCRSCRRTRGRSRPTHWLPLGPLAKAFQDLPQKLQTTFIQLMTMSAADFLDQWFETEPLKATMSASGIIGTFQGPRSPGTAYVLLHHYMGEIDGAFRAWGVPRGRHRRRSATRSRTPRSRWAPRSAPRPASRTSRRAGGRATGVALESRRGDRGRRRDVARSTRAGPSSTCSRRAILDPVVRATR